MNQNNKRKRMTLSIKPSLRRILDMDNEMILANYALIVHKASSLSSTQRAFLQQVLQSKLDHGSVKDEEVVKAVADLSNAIQKELQQELLQEIVKNDEELGLYDESRDSTDK
tara:strand:+ start:12317 stop:12652 length:336 start_codon:yes stop_codon:yes gene_type:complete